MTPPSPCPCAHRGLLHLSAFKALPCSDCPKHPHYPSLGISTPFLQIMADATRYHMTVPHSCSKSFRFSPPFMAALALPSRTDKAPLDLASFPLSLCLAASPYTLVSSTGHLSYGIKGTILMSPLPVLPPCLACPMLLQLLKALELGNQQMIYYWCNHGPVAEPLCAIVFSLVERRSGACSPMSWYTDNRLLELTRGSPSALSVLLWHDFLASCPIDTS